MSSQIDVKEYVKQWLADERDYTLEKFGILLDNQHIREFVSVIKSEDDISFYEDLYWVRQLENYLHRAYVLGLKEPTGRQALAKFAATAIGMLEACVREFGPLPEPGVPSGHNLDNLRSLQ